MVRVNLNTKDGSLSASLSNDPESLKVEKANTRMPPFTSFSPTLTHQFLHFSFLYVRTCLMYMEIESPNYFSLRPTELII